MTPMLSLAMRKKVSAYNLSRQVFSYPTKSRLIRKVCDQFIISTLSNLKSEIKYFLKSHILQIVTFLIWLSIVSVFIWYKQAYDLTLEAMAI